ncbi:hypothetical protein HNQ93_001476 [Hymenobacter luteus]|uniref:IPT/TIG domain-containing protein n=2 Tax=Hymenobacter TaxID=89966 RepID=A0A7W9SZB7_9BACT|nr:MULTISPECIES: FG-GAP-like repeat-containing protein [Hymenobacter]MBB4601163.1 hypothetical protein [Hymenobacter latericoloratus]MBB6058630.1 hypothetical protein [Hymenobacter luteus]
MRYFYSLLGRVEAFARACILCAALLLLLMGAGPADAQAPTWQMALSGSSNQPATGTSVARATATDASGNLFLTGYFTGQITFGTTMLTSAGGTDIFLAKWNTATSTWAWAVRGGGISNDQSRGVAVSGTSVFITGSYFGNGASFAGKTLSSGGTDGNMFLAKYVDNGTSAGNGWAINSESFGAEVGNGVAASGTSVYVTGFYSASGATVAGTVLTGMGRTDMFLAKYVDNGTSAGNGWAVKGGGAITDVGNGVAVNGSNVYVTGSFESKTALFAGTTLTNPGSESDIFLAKYTDNGSSVAAGWAVSAGGTSNDSGNGVAVSGTSVYITGTFTTGTTATIDGRPIPGEFNGDDMFVAKYTDQGNTTTGVWAASGGSGGDDQGLGIAVNGTGVYVTGSFLAFYARFAGTTLQNTNTSYDAFVAKYTDQGTAVGNGWATSISGTEVDTGYGLAVTGSQVFVAASSGNGAISFGNEFFAPAKAGALGQLDAGSGTWQRAEAPLQGTTSRNLATATDASGNVFVTGDFSGNVQFGTTQLSSAGKTDMFLAKWDATASAWAWAIRAGGSDTDQGLGLAVSGNNVYVTGSYYSGNTRIAGQNLEAAGFSDLFVAKYTDNGSSVGNGWVVSGGGAGFDVGNGIAVSGSSVYITGRFEKQLSIAGTTLSAAAYTDIVVAKFTDNGSSVSSSWAISEGGVGYDYGNDIAVNGSAVYVTGYFQLNPRIAGTALTGIGNNADMFLAKYLDQGTTVSNGWAVSGGGSDGDVGNAVAVRGNAVYVTGSFTSGTDARIAGTELPGAGSADIFVAKYLDLGASASDGWAVSGGGTGADIGRDLTVTGANVYVAGSFAGGTTTRIAGSNLFGSGTASTLFVARYTDQGSTVSGSLAVSGGGAGGDVAFSLALSGANIYVAGYTTPSATFGSFTLTNPAATNVNFLGRIRESAPTLTSFTPTSGYEGVSLTINGTNLTGTSLITFAGSENNTVSSGYTINAAGTQITGVIVPSGAQTGPIRLAAPGGTATSTGVFTVTPAVPNPVPTITTLSPATAPAGNPSFTLTVTGTGFVARCVVNFNGVPLPTTLVSATQLTATVPASAIATVGSYPVSVTNPSPGGGTSAAVPFSVTVPQPPVLAGFAPASGAVGATLTLTGTNLSRTSVITFSGSNATTVTSGFAVNTAGTQITGVVVPAGAQTGPISVTTPVGSATSPDVFTVINTATPVLTSLTPARAAAGAEVTVAGRNLSSITSLVVNGATVPLSAITGSTNTSFTFVVPAGATATGSLVVSTAAGSATSSGFTAELRAISASPTVNAASGARTGSVVSVVYSEPVTAPAGNLAVYSAQAGGKKRGSAAVMGNAFQFSASVGTSAPDFQPGEMIRVSVPGPVRSAGGLQAPKKVFQFTTAVGGTGRGTFLPGPPLTVGTGPEGVALGDVDGDGDLDLLSANGSSNTVSVLLNNGAGNFGTGTTVAVGAAPIYVALADVDGDSDLDLLASNFSDNTVSIRLNNGAGTFGGGQSVAVISAPHQLALGDVDGDGDLDLLAGGGVGNTVSLRLNGGDASGSNTGQFSAGQNISVSTESHGVGLADVDGDGDLDVLAASMAADVVLIKLNGGDATGSNTGLFSGSGFVTVGNGPASIATGDVDGDGDADLLTANFTDGTVSVRLNNGTGSFTTQSTVSAGHDPHDIVLGDVDADGDLDLLTTGANYSTGTNTVSIRLNGGKGTFSGGSATAVGEAPRNLAVGDVDKDGDLDVVTGNSVGNTVSVRLNGGTQVLAAQPGSPASGLTLFPNPAHRAATLTGLRPGEPVQLLDALGRQVTTATATPAGTARLTWPAGLATGIYVVRAGTQALRLTVE